MNWRQKQVQRNANVVWKLNANVMCDILKVGASSHWNRFQCFPQKPWRSIIVSLLPTSSVFLFKVCILPFMNLFIVVFLLFFFLVEKWNLLQFNAEIKALGHLFLSLRWINLNVFLLPLKLLVQKLFCLSMVYYFNVKHVWTLHIFYNVNIVPYLIYSIPIWG